MRERSVGRGGSFGRGHRVNTLKSKAGQGLVEYALILVLVSIVVVAILALVGPQIGDVFSQVEAALSAYP